MKLSDYAKLNSITYRTAFSHWKKGLIKGKQLATGTIVVFDDQDTDSKIENNVILYARVSSSENKNNLESQMQRLKDFASAKGFIVVKEVKEIGSGLNDKRKHLEKILMKDDWKYIIVEHSDRFAIFGLNYIKILLQKQGKDLLIINTTDSDKEDLMQDFVSIITSFVDRLYGLRRSKRKTETLIKDLKNESK